MFRELLRKSVAECVGDSDPGEVALSLSGGTDSSLLLFCLLDLGHRPTLYTYFLEDVFSEDWELSKRLAKHFGLNIIGCPIPSDVDRLQTDVISLIQDFRVHGKVCIQCCHGHLYVARKVTEGKILNGSGIDGLYGCYRQFVMSGAAKNKGLFDQMRQKHLDKSNDDGMQDQQRIYHKHGVKVLFPYRHPDILSLLMTKSWKEINKPKWKWIAIRGFAKEFGQIAMYRQRGSQQIVAGVRQFHEQLLKTPLNKHGCSNVQQLYRDIEEKYAAQKDTKSPICA